jgi:hypothetical protein
VKAIRKIPFKLARMEAFSKTNPHVRKDPIRFAAISGHLDSQSGGISEENKNLIGFIAPGIGASAVVWQTHMPLTGSLEDELCPNETD